MASSELGYLTSTLSTTLTDNLINLEGDAEGEHVETTDYFFERIGDPVPIKSHDSSFDLESPPSVPLAVSELYHVVFIAHSTGFCVVRTKDVIVSAKEIKDKGSGSSIHDLSIVDVPIGKVHILALSTDNNTLAATVAGDIHFFSVNSLMQKGMEPSFSYSLNDSSCVKDFKWTKKSDSFYIVLTNLGNLCHGPADGPLKNAMSDVDAVEWSKKGNFVAVARKDVLTILSSRFKERFSIPLSSKSQIGLPDTNCMVKVDSIKWVRADCIILGCFQVTAAGEEEDYVIRLIRSKDGKITDASSKRVMSTFYDIFPGFNDNILPFGSGPYLFFSYLEKCKLAIIANRRNTDQHIALLGWSLGLEKGEVAVIDIERDTLLPRIELQETGDDNLVLGLCTGRASLDERVKVQLGVEEPRELLPYCILLCLTLEGKLVMFHVASVEDTESEVLSGLSDEDNNLESMSVENQKFKRTSGPERKELEEIALDLKLQNMNEAAINTSGSDETPAVNGHEPSCINERTVSLPAPTQVSIKESDIKSQEVHLFTNSEPLKSSFSDKLSYAVRDFNKSVQISTCFGSSHVSLVGEVSAVNANQFCHDDRQRSVGTGRESTGKMGSSDLHSASEWVSGRATVSSQAESRPSLLPSNFSQSSKSENAGLNFGTTNISEDFAGKPFSGKDDGGTTTSIGSSSILTQSGGWVTSSSIPVKSGGLLTSSRLNKIESLPAIRSSHISLQESFALGKSPNHKHHPFKGSYGTVPQSRLINTDQYLSQQFANIEEMIKELDMLLESIEEPGGFRDACTFQRSSVEPLEQELGILSDKCQMLRFSMDERLQVIEGLVDKTVKVLAKKMYIEAIVQQATDSRYWDLWDQQKLSYELELKRQRILKMNEDMTNRLIELEKHLNGLELNKFGEYGRTHDGRRALQSRFGSSRRIQSLHSLHNTMRSQLEAAELLSERLSKQMIALSVGSPSAAKQNVKKELFETIGLPFDASYNSPDVTKAGGFTSSDKKLLLLSEYSGSKDQFLRSTATKNHEPETARRRRDSLDRSLASFEPIKATVKRMLLQESQRTSEQRTSLLNQQHFSSRLLGGTTVANPAECTTPVLQSKHTVAAIEDKYSKLASEKLTSPILVNNFAQPSDTAWQQSRLSQRTNVLSPLPESQHTHASLQNSISDLAVQKSYTGISYSEKSDFDDMFATETKSSTKFKTNHDSTALASQRLSSLLSSQRLSSLQNSAEMSNFTVNEKLLPSSTIGNITNRIPTKRGLPFETGKEHDSQVSRTSAVTAVASFLPEKLAQFDTARDAKQPDHYQEASPSKSSIPYPATLSMGTLSSTPSSTFPAPVPSTKFPFSFKTDLDSNQTAPTSTSSAFPLVVSAFDSFTSRTPKTLTSSPKASSPTSDTPKTEPQPPSRTDTDATKQSPALESDHPAGILKSKLETSASSTDGNSTLPISGSQPLSKDMGVTVPNVTLDAQPQQSSTSSYPLPMPNLNSESVTEEKKSEPSDVRIAQDDNMDEEASETNNTAEFNLGNLGGFGIGSNPITTTPKPNTFGGPFGNVAMTTVSSPFTMTVPNGELFRPASFSFQSPSQASQPASSVAFSSGIGSGVTSQAPNQSGFGKPSQIGVGQQALGSVLGAFGQSRQLGPTLPGNSSGSPSGFGGGFTGMKPVGGFASAATGGGFAGGGFGGVASGGGGFAGAASAAGGFSSAGAAAGGFAGAASSGFPSTGGGFGAFNSSQGSGGFSAFGTGAGGTGKPPELFTQIRK